MTALKVGSESWWQSKHGPEWQRLNDEMFEVTFWWRDPQGSEEYSTIKRVWIYITGVTDHHQNSQPQSMQRIAGTNVWQWTTQLNANWRGSYCFIPTERDDIFSAPSPDRLELREGWRKLLPQAIADPLNPQSWKGGRGHAVSALEMPQAPLQPGWDCPQAPETPAKEIIWKSERLKNSRRVWIFTTGDATAEERPLAVLLDGEFWAQSMPVWPVLTSLTHRRQLIEQPAKSVIILVSDFYEGGSSSLLTHQVKKCVQSGIKVLGLAALDSTATPCYDHDTAQALVNVGAQIAAMTPGELASWLAENLQS